MSQLKKFRKRANLSQERLADLVNSGRSTIVKMERGEMVLSKKWAERLAPHLNCKPYELLFAQDEIDAYKPASEYNIKFGKRLKKARKGAGFSTIAAFARALNVKDFRCRAWEDGKNTPPLKLMLEISRLTDWTLDQLMRP